MELLLSYHAIEDVTGRYHDAVSNHQTDTLGETGLCHQTVRLRMKMAPQPEWLCVDFGTSAVVAAYARDIFACSDTLVNLKEQKDFLLRQAYTEQNSVKASSADEEGAHLISSTICLNSKNQGDYRYVGTDGAEYMNYAVWFSPSANDIQLDYQLPCLKTIMGYRHLPPIFSHSAIENFTYLQDGEERSCDILSPLWQRGGIKAGIGTLHFRKTARNSEFQKFRFSCNSLIYKCKTGHVSQRDPVPYQENTNNIPIY